MAQRPGRAALRRISYGRFGQPDLPVGGAKPVRDAVCFRASVSFTRRGDHRLRRRRRGRDCPNPAGQRDCRHRAVPQARSQPAADRHVSQRRAGRRLTAVPLYRLGHRTAGRRLIDQRSWMRPTTTPATIATTAARASATKVPVLPPAASASSSSGVIDGLGEGGGVSGGVGTGIEYTLAFRPELPNSSDSPSRLTVTEVLRSWRGNSAVATVW